MCTRDTTFGYVHVCVRVRLQLMMIYLMSVRCVTSYFHVCR